FTMIYFDLDNFKAVNDRFGHSVGNRLLCRVSQALQAMLRRTDMIARLGGDEFAILLPETAADEARIVAEKLHQRLTEEMRAALRHIAGPPGEPAEPVFTLGDLKVDLARRQVFVSAKEIHLTPIEYKLLLLLVQHAGKVITHQHLLREVWGPGYANESHYLRVYMGQLRHKLEAEPARPKYLLTEPGVGYRLVVRESA
ncbi:MAG: diguanylate cyclase, partial [Anaerolineae bacterium]|nr:diguanylate cyclase [Anaerolineae bacterium]